MFHFDSNQILPLVDYLNKALSYLVGCGSMRSDSVCSIRTANGIGKIGSCVARYLHHVIGAQYWNLENNTITGLNAVSIVTDGLSVGIYGQ